MTKIRPISLLLFVPWLAGSPTYAQSSPPFDIVINGGRVMDPGSGMDAIMNVGIRGDSVAAISRDSLVGRRVINARGLVVAPGFIDILSYAPREAGNCNKLADGVTTNLAMHGGTASPERWYPAMALLAGAEAH